MSKVHETSNLPAPLSLTLEEASKVAAGSSGFVLSAAASWWWKGQPAFAFLNQTNPVANVSNAVGGLATAP
jgi:hypothetical protein